MDAIHALSHKLEEVIKAKHLGEFDGDEFGGGDCTLYMYGPDADALFAAILGHGRPFEMGGLSLLRARRAVNGLLPCLTLPTRS